MEGASKESKPRSHEGRGLAARIATEEYEVEDAEDFSERVRLDLMVRAQKIVDSVEKKIGKQSGWLLRFFPPKSGEGIKKERLSVHKGLDGNYNEQDLSEMHARGLTLGGLATPQKEVDKAIKFLVDKELKRRGQLENLLHGYAVLDLDGKQVTIGKDSYSTKHRGTASLAEAIKYLAAE